MRGRSWEVVVHPFRLEEALRDQGGRLLTLTQDAVPADVPTGTLAQPAYEWMLAGPGETPLVAKGGR
jgi:hypothetical protein